MWGVDKHLVHFHFESFENLVQMDFLDRLFTLLAECEMAEQHWASECECIHIFRRSCEDFPCPGQYRTLRLCFCRGYDEGNSHELE